MELITSAGKDGIRIRISDDTPRPDLWACVRCMNRYHDFLAFVG